VGSEAFRGEISGKTDHGVDNGKKRETVVWKELELVSLLLISKAEYQDQVVRGYVPMYTKGLSRL
jgi:hypothetical protein